MCWKQEWAAAYNNLQWAITHTERAKEKLEKRALNQMGKTLSPAHVEAAKRGWEECDKLIDGFKGDQEQLKKLINEVGLWIKDDPARTRTLMAGRRKKTGKPWIVNAPIAAAIKETITASEQAEKAIERHIKEHEKRVVDDQTFTTAWNEHATVQGVASSVGLTYDTALKYRKRLGLPKKRN